MARRLTFDIRLFVDNINRKLSQSTCTAEQRRGMISVAEDVLHNSGNYAGFRYLRVGEVPTGHLPGIQTLEEYQNGGGNDPEVLKRAAGIVGDNFRPRSIVALQATSGPLNVFPDETRIEYYYHR
jgi:hypothetical protein